MRPLLPSSPAPPSPAPPLTPPPRPPLEQFTLEQRTADILFNLTLALMFGSAMPLCYLVCAAYLLAALLWDRLNLCKLLQPAQRYAEQMPALILRACVRTPAAAAAPRHIHLT